MSHNAALLLLLFRGAALPLRHPKQTWWGLTRGTALRLVGKAAEPDDAELVRGLAGGEPWAATATWHRYAPMVYGLLDRALGPAGESEDLTQEVFYRVFAAAKRVRDPHALGSFIYSAALRMLRWHLRSKRIRRLFMLSDSGELPERAAAGADSEGRELLQRFYRLLDTLGTNERTAFTLRHIEQLSLEEMVKVTGASLATVKRRVRRASEQVSKLAQADPELAQYFVRGDASHDL